MTTACLIRFLVDYTAEQSAAGNGIHNNNRATDLNPKRSIPHTSKQKDTTYFHPYVN